MADTRKTRRVVSAATALWLLGGCGIFLVDHAANAREFCERSTELLEVGSVDDGGRYTEDQAVYLSDEISRWMRYAEDGTHEVRRLGRALADDYDDVRSVAGDDDVPADEVEELYTDLRANRGELRAACAEVLASNGTVER